MKRIMALEVPSDPEALLKSLECYEAQGEVPTGKDVREVGLIEAVALDLALSMDVFSAVPLVTHPSQGKNTLNDDELERATQALSITDDGLGMAPPVTFNFLRPRRVITDGLRQGVGGDMDGSGTVDLPFGVRQLLGDWKLGADPNQFTFRNPYEEHEPTFWQRGRKTTGKKPEIDGLGEDGWVKAQTRSQIPVILASSQMPPTISTQQSVNRERVGFTFRTDEGDFGFGSTQAVAISQPLEILSQGGLSGTSSQTLLGPSTQVLPGPHGGRPEGIVAKKKQKKRAKGF